MNLYIAIASGGALGALARYWLTGFTESFNSSTFPMGTFVVTVLGSLIIGLVFILMAEKMVLSEQWRPLITVGFLGAMTTFSTFSLDALLLFQQGHYNSALLYVLATVLVCIFAAFAGMQLARLLF